MAYIAVRLLEYLTRKISSLIRVDNYCCLSLIFLPLCLILGTNETESYYSRVDNDISETIIDSMRSKGFEYILLITMTLACSLLLEVCIDIVSEYKTIIYRKGSLINLLVLLSLVLTSMVNFFIARPNLDYQLYYRIHQLRLIVIFTASLSYASRYGRGIWRSKYILFASVIGCIGCTLRTYLMTQINKNADALNIISICFQMIFTFVITTWYIRWCIYLKRQSNVRIITDDEWNCTVYMTIATITLGALLFIFFVFKLNDIHNYQGSQIVGLEIIFIVFVSLQSMHQARVIKKESDKQKVELEFKRMFVRYISHEVRTPLNTAIMGLQVLAEEIKGDQNLEIVKDVKISCDVAVNVLNELLTFDKLEGGTLMLDRTLFKAMTCILETVHPFQLQARKVAVILRVTPKLIHDSLIRTANLDADRNKISQIIRNLVSNGLKFTPPGGTVDVLVDVIDGHRADGSDCKFIEISVVDSGAGISQENIGKLFNEIVQFNPGRLQDGGGSGLGLYISNGIAKLHGGRISVYSRGEGHGCTFTFTIPCMFEDVNGGGIVGLGQIGKSISGIFDRSSFSSNGSEESFHRNESLRRSKRIHIDDSSDLIRRIHSRDLMSVAVSRTPSSQEQLSQISLVSKDKDTSLQDQGMNSIMNTTMNSTMENKTMTTINTPQPSPTQLHCLVVDDTATSRKMQCRLLKKRSMSCIEAENGQQAVDQVRKSMEGGLNCNTIDMVIMDCNMPVMNGMDAARMMRDMGYTGYIIGVTGNVTAEDIEDFICHGANLVLVKPLDIQKFDIAVERLLSTPNPNKTIVAI